MSNPQPGARPVFKNSKTSFKIKWGATKIEESYKLYPPYELEIEIPQFMDESEDIEQLNLLQQAYAFSHLLDFRLNRLSTETPEENWEQRPIFLSTLTVSFEVCSVTDSIISIKYSLFHYGAMAAHGNHYTEVANYQRNPLTRLRLFDIFMPDESFLDVLSKYCVENLAQQKHESKPSKWILEGAGPKIDNYKKFNLTKDGLLVTFDEYQVGCYAEGGYTVFVPKDILLPYVRSCCSVQKLWAK